MARIAVVTTGIASHLNVAFEIARRLQLGGHTLVFLTQRARAAAAVAREGFAHLDAAREPGTGQPPRSTPPALVALIEDYRPDLVLVQSELHEAILWLLGQGIKPLLIEADSVPRTHGIPPPNSSFIPEGHWYDALVSGALWRKLHLTRTLRRVADGLRGRGPVTRWRACARAADVDLRSVASTREWPLLYYHGLEYLHASATELDFPPSHLDGVRRVGPMVYRNRQPEDSSDLHRLRDYLASRADRPLVFCSMGSILNLPDFYGRVISAVADRDVDLVLVARDLAQPLPSNVLTFSFVPQLELLAHADVAVHHGGNATVNECIDAGVPMLVCSAGRMDMNGLAARIAHHRLGLRKPLTATPETLRAAIFQLIDDRSYRARVEAHRERVAWYERDNVVLARVDRALAARSSPPSEEVP